MQVVAYDYGIKLNILRRLAAFGCRITVVPATYPASEVLKMNPDGVFFSNGPVSQQTGSTSSTGVHGMVTQLASEQACCAACS